MLKVKLLSDYPYSIAFGGKEIQGIQYYKLLKSKVDISFLDYYDIEALKEVDVLHLFGHSLSFLNLVRHVRSKYPDIKIIISPTFYIEKEFLYGIASLLGNLLPFSNIFRDISELSRLSDVILVNSNPEKKQFLKFFRCSENKIKILFNGVEDGFIKLGLHLNESEYILPKDFILSVGFFDERKNTNNLIESFLLSSTSLDTSLVLVGEPRFATISGRKRFDQLIEESSGRVILVGVLKRDSDLLSVLYQNCKFHILPSYLETPGISNIEAMMYGKNIIVGDCAPVRSYFEKKAFYCDPSSIRSIANVIDHVFSCGGIDSEELIDFSFENFSMNNIVDELEDIYNKVCYG